MLLARFLLGNSMGLERNKGRKKKGLIFYGFSYGRRKVGKGEEIAFVFVCM